MFLFFFLCLWWNYSAAFINFKVSNSLNNPIFFIGTQPKCPYCVGLGDKIRKLAADAGNKTNVVFTHADCSKTFFCRDHNFLGVPVIALIRGTNDEYWQRIFHHDPNHWALFLKNNLGPIAYHSDSNKINENDILNCENGGTHFHLIINEKDEKLQKAYRKFSSMYRVYFPTFSYSYDDTISPGNGSITAYYSIFCNETKQIKSKQQLEDFIKTHFISHFHRYRLSEYNQIHKNKLLFLYVTNEENFPEGSKEMRKFQDSIGRCANYSFGVQKIDKDKWLREITKRDEYSDPFFVGINKAKNCFVLSEGSSEAAIRSNIIEQTIKGENCQPLGKPRQRGPSQLKALIYGGIIIVIVAIFALIWMMREPSIDYKLE